MQFPTGIVVLVAAGVLVAGCANRLANSTGRPAIVGAPPSGQATVVFHREGGENDGQGHVVLYEITRGESEFLGFIPECSQIAVAVPAGAHRFMTISGTAEFMDAELRAGRTYYAELVPFQGDFEWKKSFAFKPVHPSQSRLAKGFGECRWRVPTERARRWAAQSMRSVDGKKAKALSKVGNRPASVRMRPGDGQ